jgi:hypothetical protein
MSKEELEMLQKALLELTRENNTKEKAIRLFMEDGYFDENGKLAQEYCSGIEDEDYRQSLNNLAKVW